MLTSLFGDLPGPAGASRPTLSDDGGFAPTAALGSADEEVGADGARRPARRLSQDLLVAGSPAQAIRAHFATTRADLDTATALLTLVDPGRLWAPAVVRALSDVGGRPIERLHLRDRATLRPLATIERATLVRRQGDTLRITHADVHAPGSENAEIPVALMERSQMTAVIVGPLDLGAVDALLRAIQAATMLPSWRCPNLIFLLPPEADAVAARVRALAWPARLGVEVVSAPMTGASAVWNTLLAAWNQLKTGPAWETPGSISTFGDLTLAGRVVDVVAGVDETDGVHDPRAEPEPAAAPAARVDALRWRALLAGIGRLDGTLGCALVDTARGSVVAAESTDPALAMDAVAAGAARLLEAHRRAGASWHAAGRAVDEVLARAGPRGLMVRLLAGSPGLGIVVVYDLRRLDAAPLRNRLLMAAPG